jgi:F-type H+-transporting ATPase subunit epsilon
VWGGFADVEPSGLTILAEHAVPIEEVDLAKFEADIKDAEEDLADAQGEEAKQFAGERLAQLVDLREALTST